MASDTREWTFYIVRCSDGSLYCGIALDVAARVKVHNAGQGADHTTRHRPVVLAYSEVFPSKSAARRRELQVKNWRAEKKELLVHGFPSTSSG